MKNPVFYIYISFFKSIFSSMHILAGKYLRAFIGAGILIIIAGCARFEEIQQPQNDLTEESLLKGYDLFGEEAKKLILPDVDVLGLSPKMVEFLDEHVPKNFSERSKIRAILRVMITDHYLHMRYDVDTTLTASGAFDAREGNCLGFSYLFVSFARARGLKVRFRQVEIPPEWSPTEEQLHFLLRHMNVFVDMKFAQNAVVDIDQRRNKEYYPWRYISDDEAISLYYGNRGVNFMVKDEKVKAFTYMVKALVLSPNDPFLWSNLGVLYRKYGLLKQAEKAYFIALSKNQNNSSSLNNLQVLYALQGLSEKSDYYRKRALTSQRKNPYYYYFKAKAAFKQRDYKEALSWIKEAIKRRKQEPLFHKLKEKIEEIVFQGLEIGIK